MKIEIAVAETTDHPCTLRLRGVALALPESGPLDLTVVTAHAPGQPRLVGILTKQSTLSQGPRKPFFCGAPTERVNPADMST